MRLPETFRISYDRQHYQPPEIESNSRSDIKKNKDTIIMKNKFWWPQAIEKQITLLQNFYPKIENYETDLNLTQGQIMGIQKICEDIIAAYNFAENCKMTMQAVTAWRDQVLTSPDTGEPLPAVPVFPQNAPTNPGRGLIKKFMEFRDMIVKQPGYDVSIGEDLGIIGPQINPQPENELTPQIAATAKPNYLVDIKGSLQGMDALRVEYATGAGPYREVGLFTSKPGSVHITPQTPGTAEKGRIRAIFIKKSQQVGNYSDVVPVTIS